jgi:hypothetical protein
MHQNKPTRAAAQLTTEMADYDKYTGAPGVWLLDLSYKRTARQWLLTHNHPFSVTDGYSALRWYCDLRYVYSVKCQRVSCLSYGKRAQRYMWCGRLQKDLVCMQAARESISRMKYE